MRFTTRAYALLLILSTVHSPARAAEARWIWADPSEPAPKNRFTYFRKVVDLEALPADATLRFAADSNARLWINGTIVRRKVARYHEPKITAEVVNASPHLKAGRNVIVVLHHNWGDLIAFQRTGNLRAGLFLRADWIGSDASWRWIRAPEFVEHSKQVVGVIGDRRIRYPQIIDGRKPAPAAIHDPAFDDGAWSPANLVTDGPWPAAPEDVETPGQREVPDRPRAILAAQWFGDSRLRQLLLRTHAQGQRDDGELHPFAPSNYPAYPAPYDWSVQWVACFYDDWMWTGSTARIRKYLDNIIRYWDAVLSHGGGVPEAPHRAGEGRRARACRRPA